MTDTFTNDPAVALPDPAADGAKPVNYFDRYDAESDAGEPGLLERARLNAKHSYYRGTVAGATDLMGMSHVYQMDDANASPEQKQYRKEVRAKYDGIVDDLGRYDLIRPWGTSTEGAAALAGQLAGGAQSPESLLGWGAKGATLAIRTAKAAVQQGFITGSVDPIIQYLNIGGGVRKEYDPTQTAISFGVGAIIGGGLHIGGELISSAHIKKTTADLAKDDPQFRAPDDAVEPAPVEQPKAREPTPAIEPAPVAAAGTLIGEVAPNMQPHRVATADGKSVDVAPIVVEASDLRASSDAGYDASLQPRNRDRAASQAQIKDISNNLDPARLGISAEADRGAAIVGPDGMVESGNGRVMAIRDAYQQGGEAAQRYRDWLTAQGVDVSKFKEPVLVRQRLTEMTPEDRQAFTVSANQSATLTMSAPERAMADARLLGPDSLDMIRNPDDLGALANRDFVRNFVSKLPQSEQGAMVDAHGVLSSEGLTRIRNSVLARAYGNAHVLTRIAEATSDEVKSISNSLLSAAPHWARLRSEIEAGKVRPDIDLTPELLEAVSRTADLRAKGGKLDTFLAQQDAFDRLPEAVEGFMRMFYDPKGRRAASAQRIADGLKFYAEEGAKVTSGGLDLGMVPVTARDIQKLAAEKGAKYVGSGQGGFFEPGGAGDGAGATARSGEVQGPVAGGERGQSGKPGAGSDQGGQAGLGFGELSAIPPTPRTPEQQALIAKRAATEGNIASGELALAKRTGDGGTLPMERQRPAEGVSGDADGLTGTAVATVPKSPQQDAAIKSLQQQSFALADALDIPLRQGRIKNKNVLGTFNTSSGVVRVREVPDFEAVAHEAGHAIEYKIGKDLTDLTNKYGAELAPLVSNPAAYDPKVHVKEGFAEFIRRYIGNPAHAEQIAPGFTIAFRDFMGKRAPEMLRAIDEAGASYRAYLEAPSVDAVGAVVRSRSEEAHGWKKVVQDVKQDGFAATVKAVVQSIYRGLLDDKAPFALAVRDLAGAIKEQNGNLVDLKAADNPEVLIRLFARSHQSAVRDMMDGVRGYHSIEPQGPSLSDALAHATGSPTVWGRWDPDKKALFSDFMVARRAALLWDKFKAGDLANPPVAFSKADAMVAMADLEKVNPRFREASNMVHDWTRELLRKQYEGGLIPADLFDKLSKEEFYVPFMRDLSDKPIAGGGGTSGSSDGPGMTDTVKRMKGSSRDIKDPIESLMTQAFLVNRTLAHNDIIRSFVKLSEQAGIEGGKFVEKIPAHEGRGYNFDMAQSIERLAKERGINADDARVLTSALTDVFGEDPIVGSFFRMEPAGKRGEPIVFYKEAGQMKAARFMSGEEGHALYETLTALPAPLTDAWSQLIAATTSTLRAGITTNPMFALTNYIRDQFAVGILRSDYVPIVSGLKGLHQEVTQGQSAILYGYGGGVSGGASIAPLEKAIENDVNALAKKGYLVNRLTSFKGAMDLAAVTEAGTRNSVFAKVFEAKKAQGLNDYEAMIEAAFSAQDVLDFSRHGSHTLMIRKYIPFINAWAQGLDKAKRTMFDPVIDKVRGDQVFASDPKDFNNAMLAVTKLFGVGGVLGAGWAALNAEKDGYRDASPQIRGTHVVIPVGNRILLVPKPFELGIGFTSGEYAYQALMQDDPRAASKFATAAWDSMTSGNPLTDIPLVKQYFELKSGKSLFTGKDIVPSSLQRLAPEMQYTNSTSSMAKWLGEKIGVSPIKVDYAVGSTFGLWGKDIMALSSGVDPDAPAQSWEDRVFIRRLLKDPARTSDVTTKFWEYMGRDTGKYNQNVNTFDDFIKKFRDDDAKAFANKLPDPQRAFLILKSAADEDGKPAFKPDEKRLHPLQRAYDAVSILNGLRRELTENTFKTYEGGTQQKLDPQARRDLIDNVRELAQMEMRNALVILKEPGYANRQVFNVNDTMNKIMATDPMIGTEIATRYATAKIYKTDAVAKTFAEMQSVLLREGSEADLGNLAADAGAAGYEFDGDKARKPMKRRIAVPAH